MFGVWCLGFCVWFAGRSACPERSRRVDRFAGLGGLPVWPVGPLARLPVGPLVLSAVEGFPGLAGFAGLPACRA
ncbi:hypothetical protein D3OALGA1CA_2133 [Olavius algarvensis associated proteobacterium Delta 3]|nr:hypothetical protein D3OALGA1CA_2133 [Olavius algarvensis associated proteobacterium Delta 3]